MMYKVAMLPECLPEGFRRSTFHVGVNFVRGPLGSEIDATAWSTGQFTGEKNVEAPQNKLLSWRHLSASALGLAVFEVTTLSVLTATMALEKALTGIPPTLIIEQIARGEPSPNFATAAIIGSVAGLTAGVIAGGLVSDRLMLPREN